MKLFFVLIVGCLVSTNEAAIEWWLPSFPCEPDWWFCLDGTILFRKPELNCDFPACPPQTCPGDQRICPSGVSQYRDPKMNCEFPPCPPTGCPLDLKICLDGTILLRDPKTCKFPKCPVVTDVRHCNNEVDVYTVRNPDNQFKFYPCPGQCPSCNATGQICDSQTRCKRGSYCEYGFQSGNPKTDGKGWCCPKTIPCDDETKTCPDGTILKKDPKNDCQFPLCTGECPNNKKNAGFCSNNNQCKQEHYCLFPTPSSNQGWCCPSEFWEKLCDFEHHLMTDWIGFLKTHKKLVDVAPKNQAKIRKELDKIYDWIDCINQLACKVREKKKEIEEGKLFRNSISTVLCFSNWTSVITDKANNIEKSIKKLRNWMKKTRQVEAIDELEVLKSTCLLEAFIAPVDINFDLGLYVMETLIPIYANDILNYTLICQKAEQIGLMYHRLLSEVKDIHVFMKVLYGKYIGKLPAWWFDSVTQCVYQLAKLYYELRECCGEIAQKKVSDEDILKKIGPWLKKAMDLREKFRGCFPRNQNKLKTEIKQLEPQNQSHLQAVSEFITDLDDKFINNWKELDKCIIKIRCYYLDLVKELWDPFMVRRDNFFDVAIA